MSLHLQLCSLSYKGYPRGIEETHDDAMMVSAIMNVLALRFCDGNKFYAFCTDFPEEGEVKNLAQVRNSKRFILFARTTSMSFALNHYFSIKQYLHTARFASSRLLQLQLVKRQKQS